MLHTHEATGSSPVVSTRNRRNRLIPTIFFLNLQLFEALKICCFSKTHKLTHTGKETESIKQVRTGFPARTCAFYHIYRICWLMAAPMVSAASCFICAVAWV